MTVPLTQTLVHLMDPQLHKWIPNIIFYTCKAVAIVVAFKVQKILSAFYSAVRGGLLVTRNVMRILDRKDILHIDPNETYIDEILGWALAAIGFYFQFAGGFAPPLVIQILLWPLSTSEAGLLWAITSAKDIPEAA